MSIHAEYSQSITSNADAIARKVVPKQRETKRTPKPKPPAPAADPLREIMKGLNALTNRMEGIEKRLDAPAPTRTTAARTTTTPAPPSQAARAATARAKTAPRDNYASGEVIKPKPKNAQPPRPAPSNPMAPHHPSRLIVEIRYGLSPEERPTERDAVREINEKLQENEDSKGLRVVTIKYNVHANCVVFLRPDQDARELIPFVPCFQHIIAGNSEVRARADQKWFKVQLNGVYTGTDYRPPYTPDELHEQLCENNPEYANLQILQKPRWMRAASDLENMSQSSVVFAVSSEAEASRILQCKVLAIAGRCWSFDHPYVRCKKTITCRRCGAAHAEAGHQCEDCTSDGVAMTGSCLHTEKCVNCSGAHPATDRQCPERQRRLGPTREGESTKKAQKAPGWQTVQRKGTSQQRAPRNSEPRSQGGYANAFAALETEEGEVPTEIEQLASRFMLAEHEAQQLWDDNGKNMARAVAAGEAHVRQQQAEDQEMESMYATQPQRRSPTTATRPTNQ
ncbi:hypothetical protein PLICRDRAFT_32859 [Plicaturopsis crispa FD-325 SS-3]|uniref:Uncharacterized protein n=1 Tax=Plicaturopsis crispa FD-325 SS-3 TaxID=944288 RepID=A0A0C9SKG3_PLICR|nr:hypothetical protein PLICRDRAFT_32859 [Plicaturopsis crispa FD-325 SS-3]